MYVALLESMSHCGSQKLKMVFDFHTEVWLLQVSHMRFLNPGLDSFMPVVSFFNHLHGESSVVSDFCNVMNCSCPGCSAHGIFQARILECVAISSFRGSSQPGDPSHIS